MDDKKRVRKLVFCIDSSCPPLPPDIEVHHMNAGTTAELEHEMLDALMDDLQQLHQIPGDCTHCATDLVLHRT